MKFFLLRNGQGNCDARQQLATSATITRGQRFAAAFSAGDQMFQRQKIEQATVRLTKLGGQGVIIPGHKILTAAHCIEWSGEGGMVLGDRYLEEIMTVDGRKFRATPDAVEVIADIAVLGPLDNQEFSQDYDDFIECCEAMPAVPWNDLTIEPCKAFPVHIRTHRNGWILGNATQFGPHARSIYVKATSR